MKRKFIALMALSLMFSFVACDDSASGSSEGESSEVKGSFPQGGDPEFYCEATSGIDDDGRNWSQIKVNIPNYKGHVERFVFDNEGNGTQYYEEAHFKIKSYEKAEMCLEFNQFLAEEKGERNITDSYCGEGVSYFVVQFENVKIERLMPQITYFEEDCEQYKREWEEGEYDRFQE